MLLGIDQSLSFLISIKVMKDNGTSNYENIFWPFCINISVVLGKAIG